MTNKDLDSFISELEENLRHIGDFCEILQAIKEVSGVKSLFDFPEWLESKTPKEIKDFTDALTKRLKEKCK